MAPPLLTPDEAAKLLHLPIKAIQAMIDNKELVAHKVGRYWRIRRREVAKLIARSK
jgi:excisionase family DNA binding protein